jgi:PAS domain S-box-containing protein
MGLQTMATILLVEDDQGVARLEQLRLERAGHLVVTVATAEEGLQKVVGGGIDLILLDQKLSSGLSGLDLFRQIKEAGFQVPAVLVTVFKDENMLVEAMRAGVRDFVPKTQDFLDHLEPVVARVLDQVRTERELAESRILTREHEARRRELEHEIAQRKRVEQAYREAEEYLRLMVESVKDFAIFSIDQQGRVVSWNPGAEHLFGYAEQEILGREFAILFTEEDQGGGIPRREIATAAAKGRSSDERWHQRKDGSQFFASGVMTPIFDEESRLRGFTKIARDITERKKAEEAVRESAVRLKAIVDTAVDGIVTTDEHGTVESMNLAAERIFGFNHEDVVGRNIAMLIAQDALGDPDPTAEHSVGSGLRKIAGAITALHGHHKNGSLFPIELAVSETRLGLRRIFTGIVRDVSEYKKAVEERTGLLKELEAERALLNSLLDNAPVGLGFFDPELRFLRINPALAELTGVPIDAHLGRALTDVLPLIPHDVVDAFRRVFGAGRSIVNMEVRAETQKHPDQPRYWLCSYYPVKKDDGTVLGAGLVVTDIDAIKRLEEALKDADLRKDQFLAMLAHELRNPLAPISNATQIMRLEGSDGPSFEWSIDVIEDQIKHMTRMVDDLLDVSRITRGKVVLQKELIELERLIHLAVEASRPVIQGYHHDLSITLPEGPLTLEVDPPRMAQVLSNLLNNAAKYTDEGGKIALTAERLDGQVVIRVSDNGIGISSKLLSEVFDLFTQGDQTLSRSRGGLGIGLTLVRSLVEMHDGHVAARSDGLGLGSEFEVRLPLASLEQDLSRDPQSAADEGMGPLPRRRVLVVDDNRDNASSLRLLLDALGQDVFMAHDGPTALELARRHRPEVVLLDIGLPGMDGYEVARQCRQDPALDRMVLVAMTGYGKDEDRRRSQEAGFNAHFVKPVGVNDLRVLLRHPRIGVPSVPGA